MKKQEDFQVPYFDSAIDGKYRGLLDDLNKVLSYDCGKRVIGLILESCKIFKVNNDFQNQKQAFREGERNIGLQLLRAISDIDNGEVYCNLFKFYWMKENKKIIKSDK